MRSDEDEIKIVGIKAPKDFPAQNYLNISILLSPQSDRNRAVWKEFAGAWNSIAYKFFTLSEANDIFTKSINQYGSSPAFQYRLVQEQSLFSFFINTQSLVESLGYALYMVGSLDNSKNFPFKPENIVNIFPETTRDKFNSFHKFESVTSDFDSLVSSDEFKELKKIRNILIHRTMPGRNHVLGEPDESTTWQLNNIIIDNKLTSSRQIWVANSLSQVLNEMNKFVIKKFST